MNHYFNTITNGSDGLPNHFVRVINQTTLERVALSADKNGTPVQTVSGVENAAKTDELGNVSFYVEPGTYNIEIYAPDAVTFRFGVNDVAMNSEKGDKGDKGDQGQPGVPGTNVLSIPAKVAASNVVVGAGTSLAQTAEYGGNGVGQSLYSANTPDAATVLTQHPRAAFSAADGRPFAMVKQAPPITAFGAQGDGMFDNSDAIDAAVLWAWQRGEPKVIIPRGNFRRSREFGLDVPVTVEGYGSGRPGTTQSKSILTFGETDGIVLHSDRSTPNTGRPGAFGAIVRGVMIVGGQTSRDTAAIRMRAGATVEDYVTNFFGKGVSIEATVSSGGQFEGNSNNFVVRDGRMDAARVGGLSILGSDANAGSLMNLDASGCGLYGFRFASLLSNAVFNLHTASNGTFSGAKDGYFGGVNGPTGQGGFNFYVAAVAATSDQLANTAPGTNNNVWIFVHTGPDPQYPIYQPGYTKYTAAGPYLYGAVNSPTPLIGLYAEADQSPSQLGNPCIAIGGSLDSGVVGNGLYMRSRNGAVWNPRGFTTYDPATGIEVMIGDGPGGASILTRLDPQFFPSPYSFRQRGSQLVEGFGTADAGIFDFVDGPTLSRPGRRSPRYLNAANLPGPFADDTAAAATSPTVPVSEMYRGSDGLIHWRKA